MTPTPPPTLDPDVAELEDRGYLVLRAVQDPVRIAELSAALEEALQGKVTNAAILRRGATVFAVRGLLELWPGALEVLVAARLRNLIRQALIRPADGDASSVGVVRSLLFDKPPTASWFVPWHRDLTITVQPTSELPPGYSHATRKHGVTHLQAPSSLLGSMLTVRIHLDDAREQNGALRVVPGSHRPGNELEFRERSQPVNRSREPGFGIAGEVELTPSGGRSSETVLEVTAGDVVVMRPRLIHSSRTTDRGSHRRVLHFELAGAKALPPPLEWARFWPLS